MKSTKNTVLFLVLAVVGIGTCLLPKIAFAQEGSNAICTSATGCTVGPSGAFIDATPYASTSNSICATIFSILTSTSPAFIPGTTIDARGLNSTNSKATGSVLTCTASTTDTPWTQGSSSTTNASTILLPAGTIEIAYSWALPSGTWIIGEGSGSTSSSPTLIEATSNIASGYVLQMGASCPAAGCTNVAIENLSLKGNGVAGVGGITNSLSHELSFVRQVNLFGIDGTGLLVTTGAINSGPYSNITFTAAASSSVCAQISGSTTATRGIRGLRCLGNGELPANAVFLDAPNNAIEDVEITDTTNGITVGQNAAVQSAALKNISGGSNVTNLIQISNAHAVTDLAIMGVYKNGATNAIEDEETLPSSNQLITDTTVGIYAIGEQMGTAAAYSRFTTSPSANVVTWSTGSTALTVGSACPSTGSMYSNTQGATGSTWYVCTGGKWADIK
jgi:hypothetical protein